jgi:hypothetical protein
MPAELERIGFSMEAFLIPLVALSTLSWVGFALWPWGLWRNRERAHTPFLPSIADVGTLPEFDRRAFLAMTWTSAFRYWRGERTCWKGRVYQRQAATIEFSENRQRKLKAW